MRKILITLYFLGQIIAFRGLAQTIHQSNLPTILDKKIVGSYKLQAYSQSTPEGPNDQQVTLVIPSYQLNMKRVTTFKNAKEDVILGTYMIDHVRVEEENGVSYDSDAFFEQGTRSAMEFKRYIDVVRKKETIRFTKDGKLAGPGLLQSPLASIWNRGVYRGKDAEWTGIFQNSWPQGELATGITWSDTTKTTTRYYTDTYKILNVDDAHIKLSWSGAFGQLDPKPVTDEDLKERPSQPNGNHEGTIEIDRKTSLITKISILITSQNYQIVMGTRFGTVTTNELVLENRVE